MRREFSEVNVTSLDGLVKKVRYHYRFSNVKFKKPGYKGIQTAYVVMPYSRPDTENLVEGCRLSFENQLAHNRLVFDED